MSHSAPSVERLITLLGKFPGIGAKSAGRLAFYILKMSNAEAKELTDAITTVKEKVIECEVCFNISEESPCHICRDSRRDSSVICVVEDARDVLSLEKVEDVRWRYHVLGGRLSPLDGVGPDDLHISGLLSRLSDEVREVVIATNPNVEGEATAIYLSKLIKPLNVTVTRIARGLPVGADLEFADVVTLSRALEGRREF